MVNPLTAEQSRPQEPAWDAMTLLVAAIIVHDRKTDQVLLLRRGPGAKFAQGLWDLPVGKNQDGEPITTTAIRELREETGLIVRPEDLHIAHVIHAARGVEAPHGFLTIVFHTHEWTGELVNAEPAKHDTVTWIPTNSIPDTFVPTTHSALTAYLAGGTAITVDGWRAATTVTARHDH